MLEVVSAVGAWFSLMAGLYALFHKAEHKLRSDARCALARWLRGEVNPEENWATAFAAAFDGLFDFRSLGGLQLPSIKRACVSSLLTVAALYLIYFSVLPKGVSIGIVDDFGLPNYILP